MIACRVRHVSKRFDGLAVVADVSFDIPDGGAVALVGPSGCGKTTVLRMVAGLETPDTGEVWLNDERVAAEGIVNRPASPAGHWFRAAGSALWPHMSVTRHLEFILGAGGPEAQLPRDDSTTRCASPASNAWRHAIPINCRGESSSVLRWRGPSSSSLGCFSSMSRFRALTLNSAKRCSRKSYNCEAS